MPVGEPLDADDERVARLAGPDRGGGGVERVAEAGAAGVEVVRAGRVDAEPVRRAAAPRSGPGSASVQVATMTRSMSSAATPLAASALPPAATAMSTTVSSGSAKRRSAMPTRVRIHSSLVSTPGREVVVGDHVGRLVVTQAEDAGAGARPCCVVISMSPSSSGPFESRATGSPAATRSPSVPQPLGQHPAAGRDDLVLVAVGADRAEQRAAA